MESLWGEEFNLPEEKEKTKKILNKISKPKEVKVSVEKLVKSTKLSLQDKLKVINENVQKVLSKQKDNILVIKDKATFDNYISKAIAFGKIAIDTETNNSLDPITCKLMGACLYVPGEKQAYIPINHRDSETKERLEWQLTEEDCREEFQKLKDNNVFTIMHNGKFDYQVIKQTCHIEMSIDWDTMIACKLINENEFSAGLKQQYIDKIDPEQEKYSIDHLFENVEYADVDPDIFAFYSATDSLMTYKLYEYQYPIMTSKDFERIYKLFKEVEMPCVIVTAEMELSGVFVDQEYAERLKEKYHSKLSKIDINVNNCLSKIRNIIDTWKLTEDATKKQLKKLSDKQWLRAYNCGEYDEEIYKQINGDWYKVSKPKIEQLDDPLTPDSLASPTQLGILLYDILKCPIINKEKPYATGEEELKGIIEELKKSNNNEDAYNICNYMLKRRELVKLISTYIDVIPELAKRWPDGRVRTHFNQYGATTGRFSSSDPINLQNIPSHCKEIRLLFKAQPGYVLLGSDFGAQEPRLLSQFSQDQGMINAYKQEKDLYAIIAQSAFHNNYEDNLEHYKDGTLNPEGKKRRSVAKTILLGLMYSRGAASIADQIGSSVEEAQKIIDDFYKGFPKVEKFVKDSEQMGKNLGYVEDLWGRRRRLPDIKLPKFTVRYKDKKTNLGALNPFLGCKNRETEDKLIAQYIKEAENCKSKKQIDGLKLKAEKDGIEIINNGGFIAQAQRQCVNARIQGSAATMTKKAMVKIHRDERLKKLNFKLLIGVHDELIGECPLENVDEASKYLTEDMITCVGNSFDVPFKCDPDFSFNWYFNDLCSVIKEEYIKDVQKNNKTEEQAFKDLCAEHSELTKENLYEVIHRDFKTQNEDDWQSYIENLNLSF